MSRIIPRFLQSRRAKAGKINPSRLSYSIDRRVRSMLQALETRDVPSSPAPPPGFLATTVNYANTTALAIPAGPAVVSSTLVVSGAQTFLHDVDLNTFITHTFASDLDMTLMSPAGTIVTITTDNGGSTVNVYNGTLWDDDADPLNQVPYNTPSATSNMASDTTYVSSTVEGKLTPEEPFGAFIGEDPNGTWTITISDDEAGDSGSLSKWSLDITTLNATPTSLTPVTFTNSTALAIPAGPAVVSATLDVSGAPTYLSRLTLQTFITHTFASDLDITLMSPAGTIVTITTDNGGSTVNVYNGTLWDDDADPLNQVPYNTPSATSNMASDTTYVSSTVEGKLTPEEPFAAFIGEDPNGTWTITISDDEAGDSGSLASWKLNVGGVAAGDNKPTASVSMLRP